MAARLTKTPRPNLFDLQANPSGVASLMTTEPHNRESQSKREPECLNPILKN
jgi:hypothetical protein